MEYQDKVDFLNTKGILMCSSKGTENGFQMYAKAGEESVTATITNQQIQEAKDGGFDLVTRTNRNLIETLYEQYKQK